MLWGDFWQSNPMMNSAHFFVLRSPAGSSLLTCLKQTRYIITQETRMIVNQSAETLKINANFKETSRISLNI